MLRIDYREPQVLRSALADLGQVETLEFADYAWQARDEVWGIQRYTVGTLLSYLATGDDGGTYPNKLSYQLAKLQAQAEVPIVLLEGVYYPASDGALVLPRVSLSWRYASLEAELIRLQRRGFFLARTPSLPASVRLIRCYYQHSQQPAIPTAIKPRRLFSMRPVPRPLHIVAGALTGVGVGTVLAQRLLERFKTPLAVFNASVEELRQVEGIGPRTSQAIWEEVRQA